MARMTDTERRAYLLKVHAMCIRRAEDNRKNPARHCYHLQLAQQTRRAMCAQQIERKR